jgi:uncharacterized protein
MNIGIIGPTGSIGRRTLEEARRRGHHVTAIVRAPARIPAPAPEGTTWRVADATDAGAVAAVLDGLDVLVSSFQPGNAARDLADTLRRSIADPGIYVVVVRALIAAIERARAGLRLIVVGGAGSLEARPGLALVDAPDLVAGLAAIGLPAEYAVAVAGHRDALNVLRVSNRNWTYASPALEIGPGERTARFRVGGDQPVRDADGRSRISFEDFAVALVDEIEQPRFVQRRFTVGY